MWILKHLGAGGDSHYLLPGKEYVVGRKNCEVLLSNDQSISRAHATLTATGQNLTVKDSSKYGTFVNDQRLAEGTSLSLKAGDRVTFGVFESKFSVDRVQLVVCSSCVDNEGKARLSQALLPLGGKLVTSWTQDCTHLVMPTVKVTIKTISALLCCRPIIKQEFISELSAAVQQKRAVPEADRFLPELDEPSLDQEEVDLKARPERKRLFAGKTFVFLSNKQLRRLSAAVGFGGGRSQLLEEGSPLPRPLLQSPQSCVVDLLPGNSQASLLPSSTMDWTSNVRKALHEKGLRLIPESEIGLAAIYISCDKYCNPTNAMTDTVWVSDTRQSTTKSRIPGATLSQNAVEETVLPGGSLDITAYAVNTEPSQGISVDHRGTAGVTGVTTVGETPEKRRGDGGSSVTSVAETVSSSLGSSQSNTASHRRQGDAPPPPHRGAAAKAASGGTTLSPHTQKPSAVTSPQKQAALTSFFQPISKKRPREADSSPAELESKRAMPPPSTSSLPLDSLPASSGPSGGTERLDSLPGSSGPSGGTERLLFPDQSPCYSSVPEPGRKRKEMDAGLEPDELESIMSQGMDDFDDQLPDQQVQPAERNGTRPDPPVSADQKDASSAGKLSSKRLRLDPEESTSVANRLPCMEVEELSASNGSRSLETEERASSNGSRQPPPPAGDAAAKEEEVSVLVHSEEGDGVAGQPKPSETPLKPSKVKLEKPVSAADENHPQVTVLIQFKSLTVTAPPRGKPRHFQGNGSTDFKRFRKVQVAGAEVKPSIIKGSDLSVYNRSTNSELDEWMRDVHETEQQKETDENLGDDLFRYNPSKVVKKT